MKDLKSMTDKELLHEMNSVHETDKTAWKLEGNTFCRYSGTKVGRTTFIKLLEIERNLDCCN